jgi:hypothetical protein
MLCCQPWSGTAGPWRRRLNLWRRPLGSRSARSKPGVTAPAILGHFAPCLIDPRASRPRGARVRRWPPCLSRNRRRDDAFNARASRRGGGEPKGCPAVGRAPPSPEVSRCALRAEQREPCGASRVFVARKLAGAPVGRSCGSPGLASLATGNPAPPITPGGSLRQLRIAILLARAAGAQLRPSRPSVGAGSGCRSASSEIRSERRMPVRAPGALALS